MSHRFQTGCVVAGGGPAGLMAGYLMARAGVETIVLEKHGDFLRDFRGDTVHPSTLEIFHELGLLEKFLQRPHQRLSQIAVRIGGEQFRAARFDRLPTRCKFIAFMPQWEFLDFLADEARQLPTFTLMMNAEVTGLVQAGGRVTGIRAETAEGPVEIAAALTIGADGRKSAVREASGLPVKTIGAPVDVLWFSIPREEGDTTDSLGNVAAGTIVVTIDRGTYWQCAFVIPKGSLEQLKNEGIEAFRRRIAEAAPFLGNDLGALSDWDAVKLLTVEVNRLEQWSRPGLLCIGDSAHAMSPVGGVGINLAVQDAVAAANLLAAPLAAGTLSDEDLSRVQQRRAFPTRATQFFQVQAQNRILAPVLESGPSGELTAPTALRLVDRLSPAQHLLGRMIGLGVRPEHVRSPERSTLSG